MARPLATIKETIAFLNQTNFLTQFSYSDLVQYTRYYNYQASSSK